MKEEESAFFEACTNGDNERLKELLPVINDINIKTPEGRTGLVLACYSEHKDTVKLLVEAGADVNATNPKGTTVFMYAKTPVFTSHNTAILEYLLKSGADINAKDIFGKTVLDYVIEKNATWLAEWMMHRGAVGSGKLS